VSNRQIAALLNLHPDTVNRHVRLPKIQNRPKAPPGETTHFELFDHVPRLSFAGWEDSLRPGPGAPRLLTTRSSATSRL
jgi:hypothetical protein